MDDGQLESSSEEGSSLDEPSWVSWFCMLRNHEFFCEVDPAFVQDRFNLYGLKEVVGPLYGEAMTMILGYAPTEKQLSDPSQRIHKVLETARVLYGLIHARYILTAQGLSDMVRAPPGHAFAPPGQIFIRRDQRCGVSRPCGPPLTRSARENFAWRRKPSTRRASSARARALSARSRPSCPSAFPTRSPSAATMR